ncbi:MAG TPA: signal peptidase I [Pedococcus sp.]|jgi:signal peptidase|nr:signal peptidase I [Pedococcus sp.]
MSTTDTPSKPLRGHASVALLVLMALALFAAGVAVFSGAYQVRPVLSSSMTPKLPLGGVVITQRVPVTSVHAGDIIVFHDPYIPAKLIVHRIATLTRTAGVTTIQTKGDANRVADPWTVTLRGNTSYRVVGVIPYVGRVAVWVHQPSIQSHMLPIGIALAAAAFAIAFWPTRKRAAPGTGLGETSEEVGADGQPALEKAGVGSLFDPRPRVDAPAPLPH